MKREEIMGTALMVVGAGLGAFAAYAWKKSIPWGVVTGVGAGILAGILAKRSGAMAAVGSVNSTPMGMRSPQRHPQFMRWGQRW